MRLFKTLFYFIAISDIGFTIVYSYSSLNKVKFRKNNALESTFSFGNLDFLTPISSKSSLTQKHFIIIKFLNCAKTLCFTL